MPKLLLVFKFIPKAGREAEMAGLLSRMYNYAEEGDAEMDDDTRITLGGLYLFLSEFVGKLCKGYENDFLMPTFGRRMGPFLKLLLPLEDSVDDISSYVSLFSLLVNQKLLYGEEDDVTVNAILGDELLEEVAVVWASEDADVDDFF